MIEFTENTLHYRHKDRNLMLRLQGDELQVSRAMNATDTKLDRQERQNSSELAQSGFIWSFIVMNKLKKGIVKPAT